MGAAAMDEFRFKSMKETFEENYEAIKVPADNRKGYRMDYVYIGPWYVWQQDQEQICREKRFILNACIISLVLYAAAAVQFCEVNYARLVSLAGMLSLAPFVFEVFGVFQFYFSKEKMTAQTFSDISGKLKIAPVVHAGLLFLCAGFGIWEILWQGYDGIQLMIPMCYILAAAQSVMIFNHFRRLGHRKVENTWMGSAPGNKG